MTGAPSPCAATRSCRGASPVTARRGLGLAAAGVDTTEAGENLGGGYYSLDEAMRGWRGSPEHDANLLIPRATRFGIAVAKDARTRLRVYWAMEMAAEPQRPTGGPALLTFSSGEPAATP